MKLKIKFNSTLCLLILLSFLKLESAHSDTLRAPIYSRNQVLNQMIFLNFYPLPSIKNNKDNLFIADLSHSNIIRVYEGRNYVTWSDMELSHLTLNYFRKLSKRLELSLNLGFLSYWSGHLDHFIMEYHNLFNMPNGQRTQVGDRETHYKLGTRDWKIFDRNQASSSFRDTSLMLRYALIQAGQNSFQASIAAAIELPTGIKRFGTSNGNIDYGLALYLDIPIYSPYFYSYYTGAITIPGRLKRLGNTMPTKTFKSQHILGFEYTFSHRYSALIQIDYADSPYKNTQNLFLDRAPVNVIWALNFSRLHNQLWQISFTEDLTHKTTPDFSMQLTFFRYF